MAALQSPTAVDKLAPLGDPEAAFKNPAQVTFMRILIDVVRQILAEMVRRDTAGSQILLQSPDGTVYRVTVADDGTLTTVNARG